MWCFIVWITDFIREFWEILKYLLKKIYTFNKKHFQNSIVYYLLICFLVILTFFFLFYLSMVLKKKLSLLSCFIVWIQDFIKKFCKTMVFFFKKLRYLVSKVSTKFHRLLFRFIFLAFFAFCLLFHLSKLVQKL